MNIVASRKIFYTFSGTLFALSIASLLIYGLNLGVDFKGDARIDVEYKNSIPSKSEIVDSLKGAGITVTDVTQSSDHRVLVRMNYLTEADHQKVLATLRAKGEVEEKSFISTGPSVGRQLRRNALIALALALIAIILYVAFAFRKVSRPVSSWIYGVIAVVALLHDVFIPTGIFSFLRIEIDALFVTALLTVLGFSVHDTIVVFDRVRENLRRSSTGNFEELVERSLKETITRSINTSLTTVLSLLAVYFFGGVATKNFALALIIGIIIGTYSSIFIASPLLVTVERWRRKRS
ncbi:MAG: protein translocase subunit SecF [Patescibacteria group bacterium]